MRTLVVLWLVSVACADKLGYNYKPVGHSNFGLSFTPGSLSGHASGGGVFHSVGGSSPFGGGHLSGAVGSHDVGVPLSSGGSFNGGLVHGTGGLHGVGVSSLFGSSAGFPDGVGSFGTSGSNSAQFGVGGSSSGGFNGGVSYNPQAELEKEFYSFTANEDDFTVPHAENQISNSAKKSIRVIFIKGPENNAAENAAVALAKHIAEQKTAIYVLHKEADIGNLSKKFNVINSNINHKPEVHFVKYRTHEDAINAQKAIQSQYDSLGGVSNNYNGGEAPVLNFASQGPVASLSSNGSHDSNGSNGAIGTNGPSATSDTSNSVGSIGSSGHSGSSNSYIPPSDPSSTYLPA